MAKIFSVSISEPELIKWIDKMREQGKLPSFSLMLRDALWDEKKKDDATHSENPHILHERINNLRNTLQNQTDALNEFHDKLGVSNDWFEFWTGFEKGLKKKQKGGIVEIKENAP